MSGSYHSPRAQFAPVSQRLEPGRIQVNTQSLGSDAFFSWMGMRVIDAAEGPWCLVLGIQDHHCSGGGTTAVVNGGILPYMLDPVVGGAFQRSLGHRGPNHVAPKCRVSGTDDGRDTDRRRRRGCTAGAAASCSSMGIASL